ncbi:hypothetical protein NQ176_g2346 [Zarea fungicola]|uniref:Uncharacterized protein n=1 Tax=Zarea fungicola TaxID=93591 RepID=A0ACC1NNK8_9HYPO|nr:hypothetical protein NQ176_g2346 [Lecanicillium fungicola]
MASTPRLSQDSIGPFTGHSKIRGRTLVKPILKKLNSHSNSDRGSFDIDPGWDDLPSPLTYGSGDYENVYNDSASAPSPSLYDAAAPGANGDGLRGRDVSFSTSVSGDYPMWRSKSKYSHMRSTSGTSHTSSIATNISGRNGHFVHPFQQTPRTATPPLSYANSIASLDISATNTREYTSTINEHDSAVSPTTAHPPVRTTSLTQLATCSAAPHNTVNSRLRGPSLDENHRSASLSDGTTTPRPIPTTRSNSATTAILRLPPTISQ